MSEEQQPAIDVVYLDWHVISGLRTGSGDLLSLIDAARERGLALFPFTGEHLTEAFRGIERAPGDIEALRARIFELIRRVSGSVYWHFRKDAPGGVLSIWDPAEAHATINEDHSLNELAESLADPTHRAAMAGMGPLVWDQLRTALIAYETHTGVAVMDLLPPVPTTTRQLAGMMGALVAAGHRVSLASDSLGVDPGVISNVLSDSVVSAVDERLKALTGKGAEVLLEGVGPHGPDVGVDLRAVRLNSLLQTFGFHRDRAPSHEGATSDSNHLSFAMQADLFVTNDRKLTARARAVAAHVGSPVAIVTAEEFANALRTCLSADGPEPVAGKGV